MCPRTGGGLRRRGRATPRGTARRRSAAMAWARALWLSECIAAPLVIVWGWEPPVPWRDGLARGAGGVSARGSDELGRERAMIGREAGHQGVRVAEARHRR